MSAVKVPAQHVVDVARVIERLGGEGAVHQGIKLEDLHVLFEDGQLTLNDRSGTFGTRHWSTESG